MGFDLGLGIGLVLSPRFTLAISFPDLSVDLVIQQVLVVVLVIVLV